MARRRFLAVFAFVAVAVLQHHVTTAKKDLPATGSASTPATTSSPSATAHHRPKDQAEPVIEEVTAKQLERVLNEKDYVAVFWCEYVPETSSPEIRN